MENIEEVKNKILDNVVEVLTNEELDTLLKEREAKDIGVYCGYEVSGPVHLGHLVTIMKLKQFQDSGFKVKVLFADYHTWLNRKGDWDFIHEKVKEWQQIFTNVGLTKVEYVLGSSYQRTAKYYDDVLTLSLDTGMKRGLRSMEMVARDFEHARISQVIYPLMQTADIKHLGVDIAIGGMEQRKIHALGREIMPVISDKGFVAVHTPLITSLLGEGKMSSSVPDSNISVVDTDEDIKRKIKKAHCPEGIVEGNPIIEIVKYIIFPAQHHLNINRPEKFGGNLSFDNYENLEAVFTDKKLHPLDLKNAVAEALITIVRESE